MKKTLLLSYFLLLITYFSFSQNAGIGLSNPTRAKLEVNGAVGTTSAIFGGDGTGISFQRNWPSIGFNQYYNGASKYISDGFAAVQYLDPTNGYMTLDMFPAGVTNATAPGLNRSLVIGNNGNIGIRTAPIDASLYAIKAGNFDGAAVLGTGNHSYFYYSNAEDTYIRAGKANSTVYINDIPNSKVLIGSGSSLVGINTSLPTCPLEIRQTGLTGLVLVEPDETFNYWEQVVGFYEAGPHSSLKMLYKGNMRSYFRPTDGVLVNTSDRRLKTNIRSLYPSLEKIMQLRPVEYEITTNNPQHIKTIGFIAQEVKEIFPEIVTVSPNKTGGVMIEDFHSINYNPFKILAVKAGQEEQKLIDDLQKQQNEMLKRLEDIEKKLAIKK